MLSPFPSTTTPSAGLSTGPFICPRNAWWEWRALSQAQNAHKGPSRNRQAGLRVF